MNILQNGVGKATKLNAAELHSSYRIYQWQMQKINKITLTSNKILFVYVQSLR